MKTTFKFKLVTTAAGLLLASSALYAQGVDVSKAWVRPTVQGQKASGGFMTLTAKDATQLVGVSTPVAGVAEVHGRCQARRARHAHENELSHIHKATYSKAGAGRRELQNAASSLVCPDLPAPWQGSRQCLSA